MTKDPGWGLTTPQIYSLMSKVKVSQAESSWQLRGTARARPLSGSGCWEPSLVPGSETHPSQLCLRLHVFPGASPNLSF